MTSDAMTYQATGDAMVDRILATFREHPEAAALTDVWELFKVPGFTCDDLAPSLAQASAAFNRAKKLWASR